MAIGLVVLLAVAGCGGNQQASDTSEDHSPTGNSPQTTDAPQKTKLTLGGIEYAYSELVAEAFQKKNPDIELKLEYGPQKVDDGTLQALIKSGEGPELLVVGSGPSRIEALARDQLIRPINDIYQKLNLEDRYKKDITDQLKSQDKDGNIYEVVEGTDVFQIYYNKKIFQDLNIAVPPQTWDEFLALCDTLKKAGIKPIAAGFKGGFAAGWLGGLLWESSAGSEAMAKVLYEGASFNSEPFVKGVDMFKELIDRGFIDGKEALALDYYQAGAGFYNDQYGMFAASQSVLLRAEASDGIDVSKFGSFYLPSVEQGRKGYPTAGIAHSWVVNVNADESKMPAIEKWIDFVSSQDYLAITLDNGANLIPGLAETPEVASVNPLIADAIANSKDGAGFNPSVYLPGQGKTAMYETLQGVTGGTMTPAQAVEAIDKAIRQ